MGNMECSYFVYIMANQFATTLYTGVTNDLLRRVYEHKQGLRPCFTQRYHLNYLMYFDETDDVSAALYKEKQIKNWRRDWKLNLIRQMNPRFEDLAKDWYDFDIK